MNSDEALFDWFYKVLSNNNFYISILKISFKNEIKVKKNYLFLNLNYLIVNNAYFYFKFK